LKDRFGVSRQVVPTRLLELLRDPDPHRGHRTTQAMLGMRKLDVAALEGAAATTRTG
jgi:predicted 3-demethylubiquinone-9 3-methyltransferase (glyoxalase superfamily)